MSLPIFSTRTIRLVFSTSLSICTFYSTTSSFTSSSSSSSSDTTSSSPIPLTNAALESLKNWNNGTMLNQLNRSDHTQIDPQRRVIAVLGITGAGKSSTANSLAGRTVKQFFVNGSVTSVTQAVTFRDYNFLDIPWRVIDTPGLCDTNKSKASIREELLRLSRYTPHGITAFIIVVPRGRFTQEQESALKDLIAIFGEKEFLSHSLVAITSATDLSESRNLIPRDMLIEEINNLPIHHYFRNLVEGIQLRVVPVENRVEPARQISRMTLHQRILDIEQLNQGKRYSTQERFLTEGAVDRITAAMDFNSHANKGNIIDQELLQKLQITNCKSNIERSKINHQQMQLHIQCDILE